MPLPMRFELLSDCPSCRVEGALLEVFDEACPACRLGVAASATCRLCGVRFEGRIDGLAEVMVPAGCPRCGAALPPDHDRCGGCGTRAERIEIEPAVDLSDRNLFDARLAAWAIEEGHASGADLVAASFDVGSVDELHARVLRRERTGTNFDVIRHLFGHTTVGGSGATVAIDRPAPAEATPPPEPARRSRVSEAPECARAFLYPIVSVMVADGEIQSSERAFLDAVLKSEGQPPLGADELRVHRPFEVARRVPPERRREAVQLMTQLAAVDGVTDAQEVRIVRAYAAAWGVPSSLVDEWISRYAAEHATGMRRFVRALRAFFFSTEPTERSSS